MLSLLLASLFFIAIHLGVAGTRLRDRAVALAGSGGYRAGFAIASIVGIAWLVVAYRDAPYVPLWGMLGWWRPLADLLMIPAVCLFVIGLSTPNPTSVAHGLTTCVAAFVQLVGSAAPGDSTSVLTCVINGANVDVYAWKNTGGTDPTLVASTGTETFNWFAIGT